jgi:FSR family fosmidomycin resistance protein-like MFS transporter
MKSQENTNISNAGEPSGMSPSSYRLPIGTLTFGHMTVDIYNSFLPPLLPILVERLGLSMTMSGVLAMALGLSASAVQPLTGFLADRSGSRWPILAGICLTTMAMSHVGMIDNPILIIAVLIAAGLGVALYHPQAAALVGSYPTRSRGLAMSFFSMGGNIGFSLGPLILVLFASTVGLEKGGLLAVPGLLVAAAMFLWGPKPAPVSAGQKKMGLVQLLPIMKKCYGAVALLWWITIMRTTVIIGFDTYLPLYLKSRGYGPWAGGASITVITLFGAFGGIAGGMLSDRWGRRRVIQLSFLLAAPPLAAFFLLGGWWVFVCLAVLGFVIFSSNPVGTVMAQELFPEQASIASGMVMGLAWAMGGLAVLPIGILADHIGIHNALLVLLAPIFVAWGLSFKLKKL